MEQNNKTLRKKELSSFLQDVFQKSGGTQEEQEKLRNYLRDPDFSITIKYILWEHWKRTELNPPVEEKIDFDRNLEKIHYKLHIKEWQKNRHIPIHKKVYQTFSRIAAILILPVIILAGWYFIHNEKTSSLENIPYAKIYSPLGARTHFELPDGSSGWLNTGSTLKFPIRFKGRKRTVILEGEGYFEVKKDAKKPFVVHTGNMKIMALGTTFNVQNYPDDKEHAITLESGKLVIYDYNNGGKAKRISTLDPGEQVTIDKQNHSVKKIKVNPGDYCSWINGLLVFRSDPMEDVVKKISRWYNATIIIKDPELRTYRYRATFKDETLDEVLKLLKMTSPIDYKENKRKKLPDGTFTKREIVLFLKTDFSNN